MNDHNERHLALARITDVLFCSDLEIDDLPTRRQLSEAIRQTLKTYRSWNGCTRAVARAFTANSEAATERERWCRQLAEEALNAADVRPDADSPR